MFFDICLMLACFWIDFKIKFFLSQTFGLSSVITIIFPQNIVVQCKSVQAYADVTFACFDCCLFSLVHYLRHTVKKEAEAGLLVRLENTNYIQQHGHENQAFYKMRDKDAPLYKVKQLSLCQLLDQSVRLFICR